MKIISISGVAAAIVLSASFMTGCDMMKSTKAEKPSMSPEVSSALSAAKAANKKAASVGYEWRDAPKIIKKAEAAAKKGDNAMAIKLANKAKWQGLLAYKQYELEKTMDRSVK